MLHWPRHEAPVSSLVKWAPRVAMADSVPQSRDGSSAWSRVDEAPPRLQLGIMNIGPQSLPNGASLDDEWFIGRSGVMCRSRGGDLSRVDMSIWPSRVGWSQAASDPEPGFRFSARRSWWSEREILEAIIGAGLEGEEDQIPQSLDQGRLVCTCHLPFPMLVEAASNVIAAFLAIRLPSPCLQCDLMLDQTCHRCKYPCSCCIDCDWYRRESWMELPVEEPIGLLICASCMEWRDSAPRDPVSGGQQLPAEFLRLFSTPTELPAVVTARHGIDRSRGEGAA